MNIFLVFLSGILIISPFFNPNLYFLSWIAFLPFLYSIYSNNFKKIFLKGWFLGFIILTGVGYPLYYPIRSFSGFNPLIVSFVLILTFGILSLIYGLWAKIFSFLHEANNFNPFLFSFTWLSIEIIRHKIMVFFPLGYIGYTQANFNKLIQIADLGGVFLIGFLILLVNSLLFKILISKKYKYMIYLSVIIIFVFSYGIYQINVYENMNNNIKLGIIQTNVEQSEKWKKQNIEEYMNLIIKSRDVFEGVDLIVSPESALTFDINRDNKYRKEILKRIENINKYFQIGFLATKGNENGYYNSAYLISPSGSILNRYDKNKLVLFGEKVLFPDLISKFTGYNLKSLKSGKSIDIFKTPVAQWKTVICSEILYPEYLSQQNNKVDFIINQSNEAWFEDNRSLQNQMVASLVLRAVENRKSIIKAGNKTYGGIVYPSGKREKIKPGNKPKKLKVSINSESSFYAKNNDYLINAVLLMLIILLINQFIQKRSP
ncbi:MAG: apolipoprotein N-acyltransferase [Halanaerobiales bacterium]|nr:apolipoprotein N-acyltransferase [Halanaerobiales bacterium]